MSPGPWPLLASRNLHAARRARADPIRQRSLAGEGEDAASTGRRGLIRLADRRSDSGHEARANRSCNMVVQYEPSEAKRESNAQKHGVDFAAVEAFDWESAMVGRSDRGGEVRYVAIGYIDVRLDRLVFTRRGTRIRVAARRPLPA
ncbi:MAG: BrnT family toxin [Chloroflexi bacterium]|nr:BrnT family toxin [Chloroflexota bacterium]